MAKTAKKFGSDVKRSKTSAKRQGAKSRKNPAWNKRESLRNL